MMPTMLWIVWLGAEYLAELGSNDVNNVVDSVVGAEYLAELSSNDASNVVDSVVRCRVPD
jgi:hypothetical protein